MKITGGTARGANLFEGHGLPIRPAQSIVRQSLFNILRDVSEFVVLDLFSGTGSLGCEALSRGASRCVFVDRDRRCIDLIRKNVAKLKFEDRASVLSLDVFQAIPVLTREHTEFTLVFVAPPYDMFRQPSTRDRLARWLAEFAGSGLMASGGVILAEHPHRGGFAADPEGLRATDSRDYGQTSVTFYGKIP